MFNRLVLLALCSFISVGLFSMDIEWGVKYGSGWTSISGNDNTYNLRYNIYTIDTSVSEFGTLDLDSKKATSEVSHNLGVYYSRMLCYNVDSVWLDAELLWQRYKYTYNFSNSHLWTNNLILASAFADTLEGSIDQTMDYLTVPVLLRMKQGLTNSEYQSSYAGAFVYLGPSFSLLLHNQSEKHKGIKALETDIAEFVAASYSDDNQQQVYDSKRVTSASDKVISHKVDFVLGMGFNLKNIFNMGICKEEFVIDCRLSAGLYKIGNATTKNDFKLQSAMLFLGMKL